MKFRTDFVTNSSDSSYLAFNIKNKRLFEALTGLGIKFRKVNDGSFSPRMIIELPSGETARFADTEPWLLPYFSNMNSISAWLVAAILWEFNRCSLEEKDDYSDFARELIDLLNEADITHWDWEAVDTWSRQEAVVADLEKAFGAMDGDIEEASVEHTYGFEGEVGPCLYTEIKDGTRMLVHYENSSAIVTEDCDGLKFVVTGELKFFESKEKIVQFIEDAGGSVTKRVSKNTDYLICNDVHTNSSELKKARKLGISVLSEAAFIRRFGNPEDFEGFEDFLNEGELYEDAWGMCCDGYVLDFVMDNGTQPIVMEVWKDGKWVQRESD